MELTVSVEKHLCEWLQTHALSRISELHSAAFSEQIDTRISQGPKEQTVTSIRGDEDIASWQDASHGCRVADEGLMCGDVLGLRSPGRGGGSYVPHLQELIMCTREQKHSVWMDAQRMQLVPMPCVDHLQQRTILEAMILKIIVFYKAKSAISGPRIKTV